MYPFGDLPGNVAAFCGALRRDHGFRVGPGEITDAARVLQAIDVTDQRQVRDAWRAILSCSRETAASFDVAFDRFFFPGPPGVAQEGMPALEGRKERRGEGETTAEQRPATGNRSADTDLDEAGDGAGPIVMGDEAETSDDDGVRTARARYSPLEAEGVESLELGPVRAEWRAAARALLRRLHTGLSRRWRPARRGRRFDLRRTWRASLQTGGEAVTGRWLRRVRRSPNLVILIDGSRSMIGAHRPALDLAVAVASVTRRVQVCAFSTGLTSLTNQVRQAGAGLSVRVAVGREAWGGGTSIGESLRAFLRHHGERHLRGDAVVVIVSDGLDVGVPRVLADAMREIHRRSAAVVWLNPLLDTPGYEPTSRGMAAARPFITTFASVSDADDLARLARTVRLRR